MRSAAYRDYILRNQLANEAFELPLEEGKELKTQLLEHYIVLPYKPFGAMQIKEEYLSTGYRDYPYGPITWILDYLWDKQDILLFATEENNVFQLKDARILTRILNNTGIISEIFITNRTGDFLFYYPHDPILHVFGEAKAWLQELFIEFERKLGVEKGDVLATNLQIQRWGSDLIIDGVHQNEGVSRPFQVVFEGVQIKYWRPKVNDGYGDYKKEISTASFFVFLGRYKPRYSIPAVIDSKLFDLVFDYKSFKIIKDW